MSINDKFRYRPEIDGLRAIAVLSVVLYHAGFGFSGGYVGVDVFFVISGYLITSLIWKDLETGRFSATNFWERRARRIVPALLVVTIATLAAAWFLLLPSDLKMLGQAAIAQVFIVANVYYWRDSGYFAGAAAEKPLLHTWSLSVEEQFYFFVPILLWVMFRFSALRTRKAVISVLSLGFVLSFAASVEGTTRLPSGTFYLLPTRAWELLIGSILAFLPLLPALSNRRGLREVLSWAGLALILIPVFLYNKQTVFPGLAALPPCLGAGLLIWANSPGQTTVSSLLASRPVVFIGLISYSLYLWHWPILALSAYIEVAPRSLAERLGLIAMSFLCALLSWKYVETPFRERKLGVSRPVMFAYAGGGLGLVAVFGLLCMTTEGFPRRFPAKALYFAAASSDIAPEHQLRMKHIQSGKLTAIGVQDSSQSPKVLLWGDSIAMSALPAIDTFLKENGVVGQAATHSNTPPVLDWYYPSAQGLNKDSLSYSEAVFEYIKRKKIPKVIMIASWAKYVQGANGKKAMNDEIGNSRLLPPSLLVATVRRLVEIQCRPWVMLDVPVQPFNVPRVLARSTMAGTDISALGMQQATWDLVPANDSKLVNDIKAAGGHVLDPRPKFLDPNTRKFIFCLDDAALYRDTHHLTIKGANLTILPLLRDSTLLDDEPQPHQGMEHRNSVR
jgi:peptidoglycan/LPS O-acetylase OafA/YrhL